MIELRRHGYGTFGPRHPIGPAAWPHHDLFFVHRGVIELEFPEAGHCVILTRGRGVLIWPGTPFRGRATTRTARASVQHFLAPRGSPEPFRALGAQRAGWTEQAAPAARALERDVERAVALAHARPSGRDPLPARLALLALVLAEGGFIDGPARTGPPARIDAARLQGWLASHLAGNPGVPELAREAGLSPSRFRTVFLSEHGHTAGELIRACRESEARRRLTETREPLKAIAAALGYADAVTFHRAFKSRVGETPAAYRNRHKIRG